MQEMKLQLDELKREARNARATEARMKADMRREEEKQKKAERDEDRKDILETRKQESEAMNQYVEKQQRTRRIVELQENREYQEFKRSDKVAAEQHEAKVIHEDYIEQKENSQQRVEQLKQVYAQQQKLPVEENLENYRLVAEYNLEEKRREDMEIAEARSMDIAADLAQSMAKAQMERDLALKSLELVRAHQGAQVPQHVHLAARAK